MTQFASLLKAEISRVARKEIRSHVVPLKKIVTTQRAELAQLKRQLKAAEQHLRKLAKSASKAEPVEAEPAGKTPRFSASGLRTQRLRLGLSAADCGVLIGASGQSVYLWEQGKAKPRAKRMAAIAALKTLTKQKAAALVEELSATS